VTRLARSIIGSYIRKSAPSWKVKHAPGSCKVFKLCQHKRICRGDFWKCLVLPHCQGMCGNGVISFNVVFPKYLINPFLCQEPLKTIIENFRIMLAVISPLHVTKINYWKSPENAIILVMGMVIITGVILSYLFQGWHDLPSVSIQ